MDYKQKYDELIERLRKAKYDDNVCDERFCCVIDEIAPELKENEDELTWLTKYIEEEAYSLSMDIRDNEDRVKLENLKRSLAWLEKQGQTFTKRDVDDAFVEGMAFAKNELEKQGEKDRFIKEEIECIKGYRENAIKKLEELEKQCEQKPTTDAVIEKAEDWIKKNVGGWSYKFIEDFRNYVKG